MVCREHLRVDFRSRGVMFLLEEVFDTFDDLEDDEEEDEEVPEGRFR